MTEQTNDVSQWMVDAQQMHRTYPDTFEVPTREELDGLTPGALVKICDNEQRFWTRVVTTEGEFIYATVENETGREDRGYGCDQKVRYEKRHVLTYTNDKGMKARHVSMLLATGQLKYPTEKQQKKRMIALYMVKHWATLGDMFGQGVGTLEEAMRTPLDFQRVVDHFEADPNRLRHTGIKVGDLAVMRVISNWMGQPGCALPPNLTLAPKIIAEAWG